MEAECARRMVAASVGNEVEDSRGRGGDGGGGDRSRRAVGSSTAGQGRRGAAGLGGAGSDGQARARRRSGDVTVTCVTGAGARAVSYASEAAGLCSREGWAHARSGSVTHQTHRRGASVAGAGAKPSRSRRVASTPPPPGSSAMRASAGCSGGWWASRCAVHADRCNRARRQMFNACAADTV